MKFTRWFLKKVDRLTDDILSFLVGVLAVIGAISITDFKTGIILMAILVTLIYLERN